VIDAKHDRQNGEEFHQRPIGVNSPEPWA
jgi:hypothetical protein